MRSGGELGKLAEYPGPEVTTDISDSVRKELGPGEANGAG